MNLDSETQTEFDTHLLAIDLHLDLIAQMKINLAEFRSSIAGYAEQNEFLDVEQAYKLADIAQCLLSIAHLKPDSERNRFILAAVRYLIEAEDAAPDHDGVAGFDDDQNVIEAVIEKFQLQSEIDSELNCDRSAS